MSLSTSRLAFQDCLDALDKALADSKGIRIPMADQGTASNFRARVHQARVLDREANAVQYPEDHPMHGHSVYDELIVRIKKTKSGCYVYIEKIQLDETKVESLSEVGDDHPIPEEPKPIAEVVADVVKRRI